MITSNRRIQAGSRAARIPGDRLLTGFLIAVTLALAAPVVAEARDSSRDDGATVVIGGLATSQEPANSNAGSAIGVGDVCDSACMKSHRAG